MSDLGTASTVGPGTSARAELIAVSGIGLIGAGDDLGQIICDALEAQGIPLHDGDIVVIAQKIVSKAEGRQVRLADVAPSPRALELAATTGKDARLVELILSESTDIVRVARHLIIARHRLGIVLANAGIDQSNIDHEPDGEMALLLPADPSASCAGLRNRFRDHMGAEVAVLINDSVGRPWRMGTVGLAIGSAGLTVLTDLRGQADLFGRTMQSSMSAIADQIAAMASLLQGECDEGQPVVICRGFSGYLGPGNIDALIRPASEDLFQ